MIQNTTISNTDKKLVGYMLTWTTYGTWLQGNKKGYVKEGKILEPSEALEKDNLSRLKCSPVRLNHRQKMIVETAIKKKALELNQKILAIIVYSNHVHVVVEKDLLSIEETVSYYKNAARVALRNVGFNTRLWSRGFDKQFCYNQKELEQKIAYVKRH
jgi:hypothetical protein